MVAVEGIKALILLDAGKENLTYNNKNRPKP